MLGDGRVSPLAAEVPVGLVHRFFLWRLFVRG